MCLKEWIFTWISYLNIKLLGRCFIFLKFFFSYIIYKYYDILRTCIILKNLILSVKIFYNTTPTCANKLTAKLKIYFQYHTEKRSYEYFSIYISEKYRNRAAKQSLDLFQKNTLNSSFLFQFGLYSRSQTYSVRRLRLHNSSTI